MGNMTTRAEEYIHTSQDLLAKAEDALAQNDLLQASEKLWGAVAHMVKGVAERRGWGHGRHRELYQVVNRLAEEAGDGEIRTLFDVANALHSNFYENWMPREFVENGRQRVNELLLKLGGLSENV